MKMTLDTYAPTSSLQCPNAAPSGVAPVPTLNPGYQRPLAHNGRVVGGMLGRGPLQRRCHHARLPSFPEPESFQ
jgi:hypothetical protein